MQNSSLPNTTFLLVGFAMVMLGATTVLWGRQGHREDQVILIHTVNRFDLNTASVDALCLLPGIGPRLARRIVQARDHCGGFSEVEQLLSVSGIGPRVVTRIRPWIVCEPK